MPFLYDRKESHEDIVIVFKYQPVFYIVLLAAILIPSIDPKWDAYLTLAIILFGVAWIVGKLKANREIKRAMRNGKVEVSGSKFSFSNPLTFRIKK